MYGQPMNQGFGGYGTMPPQMQLAAHEYVLLAYARAVMWFAIIDSIFCFIYALGGVLFLLFLLLLPLAIMGWFGGRNLSRGLCVCYMVFIVLNCAARVLLMIVIPEVLIWVLYSLAILIEILIFYYVITFYRMLGNFTEEEKERLKPLVTMGC